METMKFGLFLGFLALTCIFLAFLIWWTLVEISNSGVKGIKRVLWSLFVICLPPIGSIAFFSLGKGQQAQTVRP